ncbi:hypothetical protein KAR91_69090 [Candidatus Pacearchaeota archaeon]|nr:hypothetical protein [Candidatus Pacearchaeota archaeon]
MKQQTPEFTFVYPPEEDNITIPEIGTLEIDFFTGRVVGKGQSIKIPQLQGHLSAVGREFIRGARIDSDKLIRIYTDTLGNKNRIPIRPSDALETELQPFKKLFIVTTSTNTTISVIASTSLVGFKPKKRRTPSNLDSGQKSVTAAGTAERLSSTSIPILSVVVKAKRANTGDNVYVGTTDVSSSEGFILAKGDSVSINIDDLNKVLIDVDTSGDGVSYLYVF